MLSSLLSNSTGSIVGDTSFVTTADGESAIFKCAVYGSHRFGPASIRTHSFLSSILRTALMVYLLSLAPTAYPRSYPNLFPSAIASRTHLLASTCRQQTLISEIPSTASLIRFTSARRPYPTTSTSPIRVPSVFVVFSTSLSAQQRAWAIPASESISRHGGVIYPNDRNA